MAIGLPTLPSSTTPWLPSMVCMLILVVGLFHIPVDARPQNVDTPPVDDLTEEWKEAADWIAASDVSDSWRAFPRNIVKSSSRWWESKLDDKIWDANSYKDDLEEEEENSYDEDQSSVENSEEELQENSDEESTDSDENKTGENGDSAPSTNTNDNDDDTSSESNESDVGDTNNDDDDDIESAFVPNGGLNSFVDQKSLSSYFGEDFSKSTWLSPSATADDVDNGADSASKKIDDVNDDIMNNVKEGGDPMAFPNVDGNSDGEVSDEVQILDEPTSVGELGMQNDGSDENEESDNDSGLQSDVKLLDNDDVGMTIDEELPEKEEIENLANSDQDNHIDGLKDDVDFILPGIDKRGVNLDEDKESKEEDVKEEIGEKANDVFVSSDAVKLDFGRGEKLDGSKQSLQNWNQPETVDKKKGTDDEEEFEDWADWDDSVFDDYDKKNDEERKGNDDTVTKVEEVDDDEDDDSDNTSEVDDDDDDDEEEEDDDDYSESDEEDYDDDEDEDDDEYDSDEEDEDENDSDEDDESTEDEDYDDDDYEDEDEDDEDDDVSDEDDDEESNESDYYDDDDESTEEDKEEQSKPIYGQPPLPPQALHSSAQEAIKDEDIESLNDNADEDAPHYNKGIIYDSSHPFKKSKPSVKKDLGGHKSSNDPEQIQPNSDIGRKRDIVKLGKTPSDEKNQQQQSQSEEKMSTGLESLTSPNPAPTVTTWTDTSLPSLSPSPSSQSPSPSPSPGPSPSSDSSWPSDMDNMMFGDQPKFYDDDEEEDEKYVDSYPLELCRMDYECRSGRTCVEGVCRCFKASFCAGHYKPVCGSDGVEYPSHCELHRSSCINRVKIRVDRTGKCFKHDIVRKEKSWLAEQQRLVKEDQDKVKAQQNEKDVHIPKEQIKELPKYVNKDETPSTTDSADLGEGKLAEIDLSGPKDDDRKEINSKCNWNEMANFKESLLMYHCHKFIEPNCNLEVKTDRQYLSMLMFSYYDRNFDFFLTADELRDKERDEHLSTSIVKNCHLEDFVRFADTDSKDEKLTVSEFTQSYALPKPSNVVPSNLEVVSTLASAGDGLELKCGVKASEVIWKRYGVQLEDDKKSHKLMVFEDGALFFSKLSLHHIGNYTCYDTMDEKNAQVHRLNIQSSPIMEVSPANQHLIAGSDVEIKCHTEGVPKPTITWRHNGKDVLNSKHVAVYSGHKHIVIHNAQPKKDSGEYICRAHSQAGTVEQAVEVNIYPPSAYPSFDLLQDEGTFLVFHDSGITAFDPMTCLTRHKVHGNFGEFKFIPDVMDAPLTLCKSSSTNKSCHWGDAVKVGTEFVYVSQPDQNRVLIVEAGHFWNPLQVIDTDHRPEKLQYVSHLDQVWVLCHSQSGTKSDKTIVVIRDASQHIQHRSVHTRPVGNHFDTVKDLFIAPANDLHHELDHGYVTHAGSSSLSKINLEDMSYTDSIDLSEYGCVPVHVAFVPLGGHIVIQCVSQSDNHSLQLIMDYLTSAIVSATTISGKPLVSPDSRHMITVDKFSGKVVVASVSNEGQMETTYEVTVSARISDVSFIPSTFHHGYDLILTSADDDDLIVMNLVTGKVEKMSGSTQPESSQSWQPSPVHRKIVASDPMSKFVMTPSKSSLSIINFKFKRVECELTDLASDDSAVMVHVSSPRLTS